MRLDAQMPGGPFGIAARFGISGASTAMPAVTNVRVRRLRTETSIGWVKRSRMAGSSGSQFSIDSRVPLCAWIQRSPSKMSRFCAFQ